MIRSFSANFYWALGGNVGYLLFQWLVITFLAQVGGPEPVGVYSFALTLTAPFQVFLTLRMAFLQSTDVASEFSYQTYRVVRIVTAAAGLLLVGIGFALLPVSDELRWAILWVGVSKVVDMYSGLYFGHFQRHERMDLVGVLRITNGALTLFLLMGAWYYSQNLSLALAATALASVVTNWFSLVVLRSKCPVPSDERFRSSSLSAVSALLILGFPLGVATGVYSLEAFLPRFFILGSLGEVHLGVYSALGYTTLLITTFVGALGNSVAPKLGRIRREEGLKATDRMCRNYSKIIIVVTVFASLVALIIGDPVVSIVYGSDFVGYSVLLAWLVVTGGLQALVSVQQWFATVAKWGGAQARIQVSTFIVAVVGGYAAAEIGNLTAFGALGALKVALVFILYLRMRSQILANEGIPN